VVWSLAPKYILLRIGITSVTSGWPYVAFDIYNLRLAILECTRVV
jgi:hypothetical protein